MTPSSTLAAHLTARTWDQLPSEQVTQMKRLLLDYVGIAVSGSQVSSGRIARRFVEEQGGAPEASVIGQRGRVPAIHAAFANAISEHSIELDDVDEEALFHYGPPVVSATLAVAQRQHANGRQTLSALLAGCEMMSRTSRATNNALRDRGFHTTPTCGVFGATVAAGVLVGLTPEQLTSALGLAGAQASGLMEMYGPTMQKRFNPGPAARNGVTAALMAGLGFTGATTILEGGRGFGAAFSGGIDIDRLLDGLGDVIPVTVEHKPYSAARPIHNAIDCALDIRRRSEHDPATITDVLVRRHPDWAHYHSNTSPETFHEAQMSLPYSVAAAFVFGSALPPQYAEANIVRPEMRALSAKVRIEPDGSLARGVSCRMTVTYASGLEMVSTIDHPKGSIQNPMTDTDLRAKFDSLTSDFLSTASSAAVADMVDNLETLSDVNELFTPLEPGA